MIFHKGLILVATPFVIELILISSLAFVLHQSDKESIRESRYRKCAAICAKIVTLTNEMMTCLYSYYQSGESAFLKTFDKNQSLIAKRIDLLQQIASGDPLSMQVASTVKERRDDLFPVLDKLMGPARQGKGIVEAAELYGSMKEELSGKSDMNQQRMAAVTRLQQQIAEESSKRRLKLQAMQKIILLAGLIANAVAGILLFIFYRTSIMARLQVLIQNTARLAEVQALAAPLKGVDEISQLDRAFHKMDRDLKEASAKEKSLFENAGDLICVLNKDLRFVKVNPACRQLWGFEPESLLGKNITELLLAEDKEFAGASFNQAMVASQAEPMELRVRSSDSTLSSTLWTTYYAQDEELLYCVAHDISERKKIELMKQSFLTMMSSDLHQPLKKIAENTSCLLGALKNELNPKAEEKLLLLQGNIGRLLALVDELLQLSSATENSGTAKQSFDLNELLARTANELEALTQRSDIQFAIESSAESCYGNPDKIMQVLVNLCSNAIKFSPRGTRVVINAKQTNEIVEIEVIDQGRGVPETHKETIFQRFKQVTHADGKRASGTGLGLPICKDIVEEHGGQIGVRNNEAGSGSVFWLNLPASLEEYNKRLAERESALKANKQVNPVRFDDCRGDAMRRPVTGPRSRFLQNILPSGQLNLTQKGLILLGIPIIFELALVVSTGKVLQQTTKYNSEELHLRQIAATANKLIDSYYTVSLLVVKYHSIENWHNFDDACTSIIENGNKLQNLLKANAAEYAYWTTVERVQKKMLGIINDTRKALSDSNYSNELANEKMPDRFLLWAVSSSMTKRLSKLIDETEKKESINPEKQSRLRQQQALLLFLGLSGNALLCLFLAQFFSKDISSRLSAQADNALRFGRGFPLNPVFPGKDEIARLDAAFHATAEKLAESRRRERAIFENSRDLICVLDAEGYFLNSNQACENLLQYSPGEIASISLLDLISKEESKALKQNLTQDMSKGKQIELQLRCKDGTAKQLLMNLTRPAGQDSIYCVAYDISARKELEQIKQEFLAVVSHDLRTPLTSINLAASLIEAGATGALAEDALLLLRDIMRQADELIELINDLLDLEKLEAKHLDLQRTNFSINSMLAKVIEEVQKHFPDHYIDLESSVFEPGSTLRPLPIACCDEAPTVLTGVSPAPKTRSIEILGDEERLQQALSSLLSLSTATAKRDSEITVSVQPRESQVLIHFKVDSPLVQSSEELTKSFNRFSEKQQKPAQHLSILAVPLAAEIIAAHNGKTNVSKQDSAILFEIELPLPIKSQ